MKITIDLSDTELRTLKAFNASRKLVGYDKNGAVREGIWLKLCEAIEDE